MKTMKTIRFKEIDGLKVVKSTDIRRIDPISTLKGVKELVRDSPEKMQLLGAIEAYKNVKPPEKDNKPDWYRYQDQRAEAKEKVIHAQGVFTELCNNVAAENPVYFILREDEAEIPEGMDLEEEKSPNEALLIDGTRVPDYKGRRFLHPDGTVTVVKKLGEPAPTDAILEEEATAERKEKARKKGMTPEEMALEKARIEAAKEAAALRAFQLALINGMTQEEAAAEGAKAKANAGI